MDVTSSLETERNAKSWWYKHKLCQKSVFLYDLIPTSLLLQLEAGRNFETFIVEYFRHRALFKHQLYIICLCSLFWHLWPSSIRNVSVLQIVLDLYLSWCFSLRFWKPVLGDVDKKTFQVECHFQKFGEYSFKNTWTVAGAMSDIAWSFINLDISSSQIFFTENEGKNILFTWFPPHWENHGRLEQGGPRRPPPLWETQFDVILV